MTLRERMTAFSKALLPKSDDASNLGLRPETEGRIAVYRRNLLFGILEKLVADYPVTEAYLGDGNFKYFVREFVSAENLNSPNVIQVMSHFPRFLASRDELSEDQALPLIAELDRLWAHGKPGESMAGCEGLLPFWSKVASGEGASLDLRLSEKCRILVVDQEGENILVEQR